MTPLSIWAPYGTTSPSVRVRISGWGASIPELSNPTAFHSFTDAGAWMGLKSQPLALLRAHRDVERAVRSAAPCGTALVHREISPFSRGRLERRALDLGQRMVYDVDDALTHDPSSARRSRSIHAARHADVVLAGNDYLMELYSDLGCATAYVPSCVDTSDGPIPLGPRTDGRVTIGWIGSATTIPHLDALAPLLADPQIRRVARFAVMGPARLPPSLAELVDHSPWSLGSERAFLAGCDLGMMPLPDDPWSRGKCAYKLLQFAAIGRTFIASPVGANDRLVRHSGAFAATTSDEWRDVLLNVADLDGQHLTELGIQAHNTVHESYSYSAWTPTLRSLLDLAPSLGV